MRFKEKANIACLYYEKSFLNNLKKLQQVRVGLLILIVFSNY